MLHINFDYININHVNVNDWLHKKKNIGNRQIRTKTN